MVLAFVALGACACACAGAGANSAGSPRAPSARPGVSLQADDRTTIPPMTVVRGVAVSDRYVFIATPLALGVRDIRFNAWLPPVTALDGWPRGAVTVIIADPADAAAVWFASENAVYRYRVGFDQLTRAIVPGRVAPGSVFFDMSNPAAGLVVGTDIGGLVRVSPTGFVQSYTPTQGGGVPPGRATRIGPPTLASVYAQFPSLQNFERLLTRDAALRSWPALSAAIAPTRSEVWLGTGGGGVFRVDPVFARGEQVPYGLMGDGTAAVARVADGVVFGSLAFASAQRGGLTFTDDDMREWRWLDGGAASVLGGVSVTAISPWESALWVGSDRGVFRIDGITGNVTGRWDDVSGLPSPIVHAVSATHGGAWVGTSRGLALIASAARATGAGGGRTADVTELLLTGRSVHALVPRGDTLWIGTDAGVFVRASRGGEPRPLTASATDSRLRARIVAIATADSVVALATEAGDVYRISARTGAVLDAVAFVGAGRVGRVGAIAMDAASIWVAGEHGVLAVGRASRAERFLAVGVDLPAPAYDVVLTSRHAWIATRDAGVRVRRLDDGLVR